MTNREPPVRPRSVAGEKGVRDLAFLIVEDHELHRLTLERTLRSLGAVSILAAANGAEAIRVLRASQCRVDVVITDLMMPDVDGIELLPMLEREFPDLALVLTSSSKDILLAAAAIAEGHGLKILGSLVKPVTAGDLRPLLR